MPVIDEASVYEVITKGVSDGQAVINVFHYMSELLTTVWGPASEEAFLAEFINTWRTVVLPMLSTEYQTTEYLLRQLIQTVANPTPPPALTIQVGTQLATLGDANDFGDAAGDATPTYVAATFRKRAALSTRRSRGAYRIGPLSENDTDSNQITAAALPRFDPALQEQMRLIQPGLPPGANMIMAVFSKTTLFTFPAGTGTRLGTFPVVQITRNTFLGSQISRKRLNVGGA